ncbi:hypothetical protein G1C97_1032 [Bifidobacterium sp. DSM 109959]|uniref:Uncharacterized protein n=1 Tax=Bifidobacterium olomucense TaxID=2675324 RepID=A0A7Y0EXV4_9BIFI|nr:hypothetical protein [Bifidobacterium sp. DSM 109959]
MDVDSYRLAHDADYAAWLVQGIKNGHIYRLYFPDSVPGVDQLLDINPNLIGRFTYGNPMRMEVNKGNAAYVTFPSARFMDNQRIIDWLTMIQQDEFTTSPADTEPSKLVLPCLSQKE